MKKVLFFLALSVSLHTAHAQEVKSSVDEFTGAEITKTDFQYIKQSFSMTLAVKFTKIDDSKVMFAAVTMGMNDYFSITKESALMLKTEGGNIVKLYPRESEVASKGGANVGKFAGSGAIGVTVVYDLKKEDIDILSTQKVTKFRLYTLKGYTDQDVKEGKSMIIQNGVKAIM